MTDKRRERPIEQESRMQIVVDVDSLTRSAKGQIAGIVYVEVGGVAFPDNRWSDLIVIILEWWLSALFQLTTGLSSNAEFLFMDGPFRFDMTLGETGYSQVDFIRGNSLQASATVELRDFADSLLKAAREVDRACFERKWHSPDLDQLQATIRKVAQHRRN